MASAQTKHGDVLKGFKLNVFFTLHKVIRDPEGRYLILVGLLLDIEVTLVK